MTTRQTDQRDNSRTITGRAPDGPKMIRAVVSLSGGRDSTTALAVAVDTYGKDNVFAVGFNYGQKHIIELQRAIQIAKHYDVNFRIINVDIAAFANSGCTLLQGGGEIEKASYADIKGTPSTYVPARNTIFGSYILAMAESISQRYNGAPVVIVMGIHAGDSKYPDTTPEYYRAFDRVCDISSQGKVSTFYPFVNMTKVEVIITGMKLKVPYGLCFSCYDPTPEGNECGLCATCIESHTAEREAYEALLPKCPKCNGKAFEDGYHSCFICVDCNHYFKEKGEK